MCLGIALLLMAQATAGDLAPVKRANDAVREERRAGIKMVPWRGGTPALTELKHRIREHVETRIAGVPPSQLNPKRVADAISAELRSLSDPALGGDDLFTLPLNPVRGLRLSFLDPEKRFLLLETSVAVLCGEDESLYSYEWTGEWRLRLSSETNGVGEHGYKPRGVASFCLSGPVADGSRLFAVGTYFPWCSSSWRGVTRQVWRFDKEAKAVPLLDRQDIGFLSEGGPETIPIQDGIEFRYLARSIDMGRLTRARVERYVMFGEGLVRGEPIALRPSDFFEEWLNLDWSEAAKYSPPQLEGLHRRMHTSDGEDLLVGEFTFVGVCREYPDEWILQFEVYNPTASQVVRVKQLAPDRFRLAGELNGLSEHCEAMPEPDVTSGKP
jgi:hypothetical protein